MKVSDSPYFLQTDRVGFRWWQEQDLPLAIDLWGDPRVTRLFHKEPLTREEVQQRLQRELRSADEQSVQYWPIFDRDTGRHAGCAGLRVPAAFWPAIQEETLLELGVHLKPEFWKRGLATEVGNALIQYAFGNKLAHALFAGHHPHNKASRNALLRLGFLGTTAHHYLPTGLLHPSYLLYSGERPLTTRLAKREDARALAIVHCHAIADTFSGLIDTYVAARGIDRCEEAWDKRFDAGNETLVLSRGEQIVGFVTAAPSQDDDLKGIAGEVDRIYLHPTVCGQGQGQQLLAWCEAKIKARGFEQISLWVFECNSRARCFYEKNGFRPDGKTKRDFNAELVRYSKLFH